MCCILNHGYAFMATASADNTNQTSFLWWNIIHDWKSVHPIFWCREFIECCLKGRKFNLYLKVDSDIMGPVVDVSPGSANVVIVRTICLPFILLGFLMSEKGKAASDAGDEEDKQTWVLFDHIAMHTFQKIIQRWKNWPRVKIDTLQYHCALKYVLYHGLNVSLLTDQSEDHNSGYKLESIKGSHPLSSTYDDLFALRTLGYSPERTRFLSNRFLSQFLLSSNFDDSWIVQLNQPYYIFRCVEYFGNFYLHVNHAQHTWIEIRATLKFVKISLFLVDACLEQVKIIYSLKCVMCLCSGVPCGS